MANLLVHSFRTLLTECEVPAAFQDWLGQNTMTDRARFLLGAPKCVDTNLIDQFGQHLNLGEKIAIRMAFKLCQQAANDETDSRTAAKLSPDSADIPLADRSTLKT